MADLQIKALLLICLLAGHEAARVQQHIEAETRGDDPGGSTADEQLFQAYNNQCKWSYTQWKCYSTDPQPVASSNQSMCAWRGLPWDWSFSESCRLTDAYMASPPNRAKFFTVQAGVLEAKSKKIAENCQGSSLLTMAFNRKCSRRMKHMMRAMKFLSKAQDNDLVKSLSPEEKVKERQLFNNSLSNMATAIGDDGFYVLMLQQKLQGNKAGLKRDPKGTISHAIDILSKLLKGSEEEKEAARQEIKNMPDRGEELSAEEEAALDTKNSEIAEGMKSEETGAQNLVDELDNLVPDNVDNETDTGSSLIEAGSSLHSRQAYEVYSGLAFVLTVLLVIGAVIWIAAEILWGILCWALIALLGCGFGVVTYNFGVAHYQGLSTGYCFAKLFAAPFVWTGRAISKMYSWLWGYPSGNAGYGQGYGQGYGHAMGTPMMGNGGHGYGHAMGTPMMGNGGHGYGQGYGHGYGHR